MSDVSVEEALQIGLNYHQAGNLAEAENIYTQIIEAFPKLADAWNLLGLVEAARNNYEKAKECVQQAIALNADIAFYHANLGEILRKLGAFSEAETTLEKAITLDSSDPNAYFNLANVYKYSEKHDQAEIAYKKAIELNPNDQDYYFNLGNMYKDLHRLDEAKAVYERALQIQATAHVLNHYAQVLVQKGDYDPAIEIYHQILLSMGDDKNIYFNLGNAYREQGESGLAVENYRRAINLDGTFAAAHLNLSFILLQQGKYQEGWKEYQWRLKASESNYLNLENLYQGGEWKGKRILVFHEQGFGDTIMMSRFLPKIAEEAHSCLFMPQNALYPLFENTFKNVTLVQQGDSLEYDIAVHINTLPSLLGVDTDSELWNGVLIKPDESKVSLYKERYFATDKKKIGIVWKSTNAAYDAHLKSATFEDFKSLLEEDSLQVYSLQKEGSDELKGFANIIGLDSELNDFSDTAALLANLDVLITIDTAVAHLAGMMGVPTHILLHEKAEWRWREGPGTPWYPDLRLHRCAGGIGYGKLIEGISLV